MKTNRPAPALRPSLLRADDRPVGRTQSEMEAARKIAKASIAFREAMTAAFHSGQRKFEDCPIAVAANRLGRSPREDNTPATNASPIYTSAPITKRHQIR